MLSKVIGIISYLPNDLKVRANRRDKLDALVKKCISLFHLPIYIESQNWTEDEISHFISYENVTVHYNEKPLGIVGARNCLRNWFLKENYDYLIMLDDDSVLTGTNSKEYLFQIDSHPGCFGEFKKSLLKLFAISKELFKEVSFDENCNPETGQGFEDRLFVNTLRKRFPDKRFEFVNTHISEYSISTNDPDTTWYNNQDLKNMLANTEKLIDNLS